MNRYPLPKDSPVRYDPAIGKFVDPRLQGKRDALGSLSPAVHEDYAAPDLPAYGPYSNGETDRRDIADYLQSSGYPLGDLSPQTPQASPWQQGLDNASFGVLQQLQGFRPRNFGQGLLSGFAQGLAGGRAKDALAREQGQANAEKDAEDLAKERRAAARGFASELAKHRWAMANEKKTGGNTIHVTADANDPNRVAARQAGISLPPGEFDAPTTSLIRDMPIDPDDQIDYSGIAQMVDNGTLPPTVVIGRSTKFNYRLLSELKKLGTNISMKTADFNASQAFLRGANSTTQIRFRQALKAVPGLTAEVGSLNNELQKAGIKENSVPLVNRVDMAMKRGGFADDPAAQALVTRYRTAVQALPSELGFAEMGGTSPTDKAMERAVKQFDEAAGFKQAQAALDEINRLASIRENTMNLAGTVAPSNPTGAGGYYYGQQESPPPPPGQEPSANPRAESDIVRQLSTAAKLGKDAAAKAWPNIVMSARAAHIPEARIIALRDSVIAGAR